MENSKFCSQPFSIIFIDRLHRNVLWALLGFVLLRWDIHFFAPICNNLAMFRIYIYIYIYIYSAIGNLSRFSIINFVHSFYLFQVSVYCTANKNHLDTVCKVSTSMIKFTPPVLLNIHARSSNMKISESLDINLGTDSYSY